ncbi:hypothetical protein ACHAWF_000866 [Thalassiosira exigua]
MGICTRRRRVLALQPKIVETSPLNAIPTGGYLKDNYAYPYHDYALTEPATPPITQEGTTTSEDPASVHKCTEGIGVSDGSVNPLSGKAAFCWILTIPGRKAWIKVSKPVRANPRYMTSFRAEMAGLLDILQYIDRREMYDAFVTLWCDNKACVLSSKEDPYLTDLSSSEADLIQAARKIIKRCPNMVFQHVLGHQDDRAGPESDRPVEVQLNIECDKEASECQRQEWPVSFRPTAPEGTGAMLYLNDDMVTTKIDEQIQYAAPGIDNLTYVRDKYEWTDNNILSINWKAIQESKNRLDTSDNIRISKLMHGWLNVGRKKKTHR